MRWLGLLLALLLFSHPALAQDLSLLTINGPPNGSEEYSVKLQIFLLMTALAFFAGHAVDGHQLYPNHHRTGYFTPGDGFAAKPPRTGYWSVSP